MTHTTGTQMGAIIDIPGETPTGQRGVRTPGITDTQPAHDSKGRAAHTLGDDTIGTGVSLG